MLALVAAQESRSQLQAGGWQVLHVAVIRHCGQKQQEKQEKEEEKGDGAVAVLYILGLWGQAVWVRPFRTRRERVLRLDPNCATGGLG